MAKNLYEDGETMDWSNSTGKDVKSGDAVAVGMVAGVAHADIADQGTGVLHMVGVWILPKAEGETWSRGDKVYLDKDGLLTAKADNGATTPAAYPLVGTAWVSCNPEDTEGRVRLGF